MYWVYGGLRDGVSFWGGARLGGWWYVDIYVKMLFTGSLRGVLYGARLT